MRMRGHFLALKLKSCELLNHVAKMTHNFPIPVIDIICGYLARMVLRDWIKPTWLSWPDLCMNPAAKDLLRENPMSVSLFRLARNPAPWARKYLLERDPNYPLPYYWEMAKVRDFGPLIWDHIKHIVTTGPVHGGDLDSLENPGIVQYIEFNLNMLASAQAKCAFSRNPGIFIATSKVYDEMALLRW
jgi:hypothetical protein